MAKKRRLHFAPRLASGKPREKLYSGVPKHVKRALKMLAHHRGESVSFMLEKLYLEVFDIRAPRYIEPKRDK